MTNPENSLLDTLIFDGKRVIEIGSGAGAFSLLHLTQAQEVVCVEKSAESHQLLQDAWQACGHPARLVHRQTGFEALDVTGLGQFDFAVFSNSF